MLQAVHAVTDRIGAAYDNDIVVQVSALGNEIPLEGVRELINWRETNMRRVLAVQQQGVCFGALCHFQPCRARVLTPPQILKDHRQRKSG